MSEKLTKKVEKYEEKMKDLEEKGKTKKSQKYAEIIDDLKRESSLKARLNLEAGSVRASGVSSIDALDAASRSGAVSGGGSGEADVNRLLVELREKEREIEILREKFNKVDKQMKAREAEEKKYIRLISDLRDKLNDANLAVMNKAMNR